MPSLNPIAYRTMVNPGAFQGGRKVFLMAEKVAFAAAVEGGYARDALANIQRRYLKRYPLDLAHDKEPTPEHLATVDDNEADDDPEEPDKEALTSEEYVIALEKIEERQKLMIFRKGVSAVFFGDVFHMR